MLTFCLHFHNLRNALTIARDVIGRDCLSLAILIDSEHSTNQSHQIARVKFSVLESLPGIHERMFGRMRSTVARCRSCSEASALSRSGEDEPSTKQRSDDPRRLRPGMASHRVSHCAFSFLFRGVDHGVGEQIVERIGCRFDCSVLNVSSVQPSDEAGDEQVADAEQSSIRATVR